MIEMDSYRSTEAVFFEAFKCPVPKDVFKVHDLRKSIWAENHNRNHCYLIDIVSYCPDNGAVHERICYRKGQGGSFGIPGYILYWSKTTEGGIPMYNYYLFDKSKQVLYDEYPQAISIYGR